MNKDFKKGLEEYLFEWHKKRSKVKGDYHWRAANAISGLGDYVYGQDEGLEPATVGVENYEPSDEIF